MLPRGLRGSVATNAARMLGVLAATLAVATAPRAQDGATPPAKNPFRAFDRAAFVEHLRAAGADAATIAAYEARCLEESVAHATDGVLRELHAEYGAAASLADAGDPRAVIGLVALIQGSSDAFVRAHARYHLGRHLLDNDEPEKAGQVFVEFLQQDKNRTPLDAEVAFFYASALADVPRPDAAITTFADFLMLFPDAPERFRAVAAQRKAELEQQFESPLHDIADSMKGIGRDLRHEKFGDETQSKQNEIVDKLQKIIEELEEQEQQSAGGAGGSRSNSPAQSSALPGGESRIGSLHEVPMAAERWGDYQDRERKAIEAEVNVRLSGPWKKLVEEYFKKLNQGASR